MNADYHINGKVIETERLILRAFTPGDLDDLYEYASVEGVGEMAGWEHHKSREESLSVLGMFIEHDRVFAVCLKKSGKVIGSLGVERYYSDERFPEFSDLRGRELGFVIGKDYWGQGLIPEAVNAVTDHLFSEAGLDFITCGYFDFNSRSRRVQEKCGFRPYRKLVLTASSGKKEPGVLNLLLNPKKDTGIVFPDPDALTV